MAQFSAFNVGTPSAIPYDPAFSSDASVDSPTGEGSYHRFPSLGSVGLLSSVGSFAGDSSSASSRPEESPTGYRSMALPPRLTTVGLLPEPNAMPLARAPPLPRGIHISTLAQPERYAEYIQNTLLVKNHPTPLSPVAYSGEATKEYLTRPEHLVATELAHALSYQFQNRQQVASESWISNVLFPNIETPIPFNDILFSQSSIWDASAEEFTTAPKSIDLKGVVDSTVNINERGVQSFLDDIQSSLGTTFGAVQCAHADHEGYLRRWSHRTCDSSPVGGSHNRKPDLSLLSDSLASQLRTGDRVGWRSLQAICEVTTQTTARAIINVTTTIVQKAFIMFEAQPWRQFVLALGFYGKVPDVTWSLFLVDRTGIIIVPHLSLTGVGGYRLARVLTALAFGSPRQLGCDDTMSFDPSTGQLTSIRVTAKINGQPTTRSFRPVRQIHNSPTLIGRGTRVWVVEENNRYFVLKDAWPLSSHGNSEETHLRRIHDTVSKDPSFSKFSPNFPHLIVAEEIDTTTPIRFQLTLKPDARTHRRIVTDTIGDPITLFRSKREFVKVLLDIVNFLEFSSDHARVLHADISINNIAIHRRTRQSHPDAGTGPDTHENISGNSSGPATLQQANQPHDDASLVAGPSPTGAQAPGLVEDDVEAIGLVIDFDYARFLDIDSSNPAFAIFTAGTKPFMAVAALVAEMKKTTFIPRPEHDLESLVYVIMTVVMYTAAPGVLRKNVPNPTMNQWFTDTATSVLAQLKTSTISSFQLTFGQKVSEYWQNFLPFLGDLARSCWQGTPTLEGPNVATHAKFRVILEKALEFYTRINDQLLPYAPPQLLGKRKHRSTDVVEPNKHRYRARASPGSSSLSRQHQG